MPRSRASAVLVVALALVGAAAAGLSATAGEAAASAVRGAGTAATVVAARTVASPVIPPTALDPSPSPTPSPFDTITVDPAFATAVPGGQQLSVTADSTTALTSMTVHLLDTTTNKDALPPFTMAPPVGGAMPGLSTWTSGVITTPSLPLGTYNVTVDAADAGTSIAGQQAGTFAFQETPSISPNPVNSVISHDNQTPTVSGTVTEVPPDGSGPVLYANEPVFVADPDLPGGGATVDTNAAGVYSYTVADPEPGETVTVEVLPTPSVVAAFSPPATFTVQIDPVTILASLSANTVSYGSKVTVNGTVSYKPGGAFVPSPGMTVQVFYDRPVGFPVATAVTDKSGRFSVKLPTEASSVHWVLQASGPYLNTASLTLPMKVNLPTVISGFQAALNPFWQLSYRGCLRLPAGVPGFIRSLSGLVIQYAAGPNGPWHTLGAVPKQTSVTCRFGGLAFSGTLTARLSYAYYRAWYPGATDATGTGYLTSASGKVLAWKYVDRIIAFSVSSRVVPKGGKLTVKGQLQYFSGKWRNDTGQPVFIILLPKGSRMWFKIVVVTTNSTGKFSATFTDPVTATWSAEFVGNSTHLATLAATINVTVK